MIQQTIDTITSGSTDSKLGIVSIAHRLSTVRRADVIYVLSRGSLVETLRLKCCSIRRFLGTTKKNLTKDVKKPSTSNGESNSLTFY